MFPSEIAEATEALRALEREFRASTGATEESLLSTYVRTRRVLARVLQEAAVRDLEDSPHDLRVLRDRITERMSELFGGLLPDGMLRVSGFRYPHEVLFKYLASQVGRAVPAWRLRILTADQVHTERRVRDLRDLGLDVRESDEEYTLVSLDPNLDAAVRALLERKLRNAKMIPSPDVLSLLQRLQ